MDVTPLEPFGVEVRDIDLTLALPVPGEDIAHLIAAHRVAVFRDQPIDDAAFVAFLSSLGAMTFTRGETPVAGAGPLNLVTNVGRTHAPRSVFHTDTSYVAAPPAFTALRPVALPGTGGATLFSDQVAAARTLPPRIRALLDTRTILHSASGLVGETEATRHPLFRRHPLTGEVALYLSTPERCSALSGFDAPTGTRIIAALYRRSIRPATLYRHHWRPGDVIIWDNRVTMHRADHSAVAGDRVLHRGMVAGETPVAA